MLTDDYAHTLSGLLMEQGEHLLAAQKMVATVYYVNQTGNLVSALGQQPTVGNLSLIIRYPIYIRFLDMKKNSAGKKKRYYEPIYNKYVYGYLYGGIYHRLQAALGGYVNRYIIRQFNNSK